MNRLRARSAVVAAAPLFALARTEAGKLNYASAGNGAANQLAMERLTALAGINNPHVHGLSQGRRSARKTRADNRSTTRAVTRS